MSSDRHLAEALQQREVGEGESGETADYRQPGSGDGAPRPQRRDVDRHPRRVALLALLEVARHQQHRELRPHGDDQRPGDGGEQVQLRSREVEDHRRRAQREHDRQQRQDGLRRIAIDGEQAEEDRSQRRDGHQAAVLGESVRRLGADHGEAAGRYRHSRRRDCSRSLSPPISVRRSLSDMSPTLKITLAFV